MKQGFVKVAVRYTGDPVADPVYNARGNLYPGKRSGGTRSEDNSVPRTVYYRVYL